MSWKRVEFRRSQSPFRCLFAGSWPCLEILPLRSTAACEMDGCQARSLPEPKRQWRNSAAPSVVNILVIDFSLFSLLYILVLTSPSRLMKTANKTKQLKKTELVQIFVLFVGKKIQTLVFLKFYYVQIFKLPNWVINIYCGFVKWNNQRIMFYTPQWT